VAFGWLALAFVLFRAFDVLKPWPCRWLERLPGGWGIMLDDVAAGVWALVVWQIVFWAYAIVGLLLFY
jgi:phosphatidylglycerophosphatase A